MFEIGERHYEHRQQEVDNFLKSVEKAKSDNQTESIGYMEDFLGEAENDSKLPPR